MPYPARPGGRPPARRAGVGGVRGCLSMERPPCTPITPPLPASTPPPSAPSVMFLDEPTTGLDAFMSEQVGAEPDDARARTRGAAVGLSAG